MTKKIFNYIALIGIIGLVFFSKADAQIDSSSVTDISTVNLVITGDVMLGGRFLGVMDEKGIEYPLKKVAPLISDADIAYCNLEPPFTTGGEPASKRYVYQVPPKYAKILKNTGYDIVNLANNHIMDYGEKALETTLALLDKLNVKSCGAGMNLEEARKPVIMEKNGMKIGFLSYSKTFPFFFYAKDDRSGTAPGFEQYLRVDIPKVRKQVDFLVVAFHWASITQKNPKRYQGHLARLSVNLGADIVVGHHPYTIQHLEIYKNKPIFFSVGKLAFGSLSASLKESLLIKLEVTKQGIKQARIYPVIANNSETKFQPRLMDEEAATIFWKDYIKSSKLNDNEIKVENGIGIISF